VLRCGALGCHLMAYSSCQVSWKLVNWCKS